jgi:hypothetical protein
MGWLMPVVWYGSEEQKERFLRAATADPTGEYLGGWTASEPAGPPGGTANFDVPLPSPAGIGVIAERDGDDFILNGRKYWPSSPGWDARGTNMSTVIMRTDPDRGGTEGLSALVVERETPGVSYSFINKMGHRLAANAEVVFDNARVPAGNLLEGAAGNEQLPDCDVRAARDEPGQPALDGVLEREPALAGELQHDGGDERLGHAADPEAVARAHRAPRREVFVSADEPQRAPAVAHERDCAGRSAADDGVDRVFELGAVGAVGRGARRRGRRRGEEGGDRERPEARDPGGWPWHGGGLLGWALVAVGAVDQAIHSSRNPRGEAEQSGGRERTGRVTRTTTWRLLLLLRRRPHTRGCRRCGPTASRTPRGLSAGPSP